MDSVMKSRTIDSFFKKKSIETIQSPSEASQIEVPPFKIPRVEDKALDLSNLEHGPGLSKQIYEYLVNMRDEIRRTYIKARPYQPILSEYPASNSKKHPHYFQPSWFEQFSWLEYPPSKVAIFCLPCFLFNSNPNLMNQVQHIEVSLDRQTTQQILANRLRLKTRCAFRGYDESLGSKNRGNFLELLSLLASYDEKVEDVLKSALQNASYTSSTIQKEIFQIYASRVRNVIREEIGDRKFNIIVAMKRETRQVKERFFDIVHVKDTVSLTLKNVIFNVLLQHRYDGASNMRGEFNGLQALILNNCQYAYYVHCFAHRLQLALVAAAREVVEVHQFFKDLSDIVNISLASFKRHNELQKAQAAEITRLIDTLQLPGETRWSSHLNSVTSLLKMYNASNTVLENLKNTCSNYSQRGDAHNAYNRLRSFEFIFILHMMKEVLGITDNFCQALQCRSQEILNAMSLVLTMKDSIQKLRDDEWNELSKNEDITVEHHYRVDIIFATIDTQLQELKSRFNKNFYPEDFSQQEKERLLYELKHYELDKLVESGNSVMYPLVDRLIRLILPLLVSTVSSQRAFSAMKIVKTRLRSKMEDDFLRSFLVVYIEKEIAEKFDINEIIDDFSEVKDRRVQFK
ncbi:hypothetical protein ES288_A09G140000v1 [Gossypium darwinii]|uniref:TTF-type domain-containing protein n=1 Tax=Gossypium darwinii TaxID=34276 RepID=A0A5D2FAX0_GOSDA|nr:hypothetical protein ES288_A09G140000v1 [Gossypium darwinii]